MRLTGRTLSTGMQGEDVRQLHDDLELLGHLLPADEVRLGIYGPQTKRAVAGMQREHFRIPARVNGVVDQATANLINAEVGRYAG